MPSLPIRSLAALQQAMASMPYAVFLGMSCREVGQAPQFVLPYRAENVGNDRLPALHGGVIGGFLENAAILHLLWAGELDRLPKIVDFSIDYLRPAGPQTLHARCEVVRQGKRVANVLIQAWQEDAEMPVAQARAHFLLAG